VRCGSSAATSVQKTNEQVPRFSRTATGTRTVSKLALRMMLRWRPSARRRRKSVTKRRSRASSRFLIG
jgi:hypothetical protein